MQKTVASGVKPSKTALGSCSWSTSAGSASFGRCFCISSLSRAWAVLSKTKPSSCTIAVVCDLRVWAPFTKTVAMHKGVGSDQIRTEAPLASDAKLARMDMPAAKGWMHLFAPNVSKNFAPEGPKILLRSKVPLTAAHAASNRSSDMAVH